MKKVAIAKYFAILAVIGVFIYLTVREGSKPQITTREFNFKYNIELEESNGIVEIWIPIPQSNEVQKISNLNLTVNKNIQCEELKEGKHNNRYYYCISQKLDKEIILTLSADVKRHEHQTIEYKAVNPDNYDKGTKNKTVFEGAMFSEIIQEANLTKDNVKAIYNYVLSGMHYGKPKSIDEKDQYYSGKNPKTDKEWLPKEQKYGRKNVSKEDVVNAYLKSKNDKTKADYTFGNGNSQYACDIGVGNCTDYHSYFMSLCRTLDIPTRFHMGFSIPSKDNENEGKVGGYHCWADYYTDEKGWSPVDISEADKDPTKKDYFFGTVNENRVEFIVGRDLKLKNRLDLQNFFIYPIIEGTNYKKSFSYKNL